MARHTITKRWLDLGELGQHHAEVTAVLGEFPYIAFCVVEVKGDTVDLVNLIPKETEAMILEELAIEERAYYHEQAEDRGLDARMEQAA